MKPTKWTVVLRRPPHMVENEGEAAAYYVAIGVEAVSTQEALLKAQKEVLKSDKKDFKGLYGMNEAHEYEHVVTFRGEHQPAAYSFTLG